MYLNSVQHINIGKFNTQKQVLVPQASKPSSAALPLPDENTLSNTQVVPLVPLCIFGNTAFVVLLKLLVCNNIIIYVVHCGFENCENSEKLSLIQKCTRSRVLAPVMRCPCYLSFLHP